MTGECHLPSYHRSFGVIVPDKHSHNNRPLAVAGCDGHCLSPYGKLLAGLPDVTLVALISANNIIRYCKFSLGEQLGQCSILKSFLVFIMVFMVIFVGILGYYERYSHSFVKIMHITHWENISLNTANTKTLLQKSGILNWIIILIPRDIAIWYKTVHAVKIF